MVGVLVMGAKITSLHRQLISDYCRRFPGTETTRFEASMRELCADALEQEWFDPEEIFPLCFLPDAFRVDREREVLTLVEAQVTSRISSRKWWSLTDFFWVLDGSTWEVELHLIDRTGAVFAADMPLASIMHLGTEEQRADGNARVTESPPGRYVWIPGESHGVPLA